MLDSHNKKHIRQVIRHLRRELDVAEKKRVAKSIADQLTHSIEFQQSQHIALYLPHDGEIDTHLIMKLAENNKKNCYLPVLDLKNAHHLEFYSYRMGDALTKNRLGIEEPNTISAKHIFANELDLVLVPLVAFDERGNRIGRGAGYYDRTFAFLNEHQSKAKPLLIGLAYDFQKIPSCHPESWDIRLHKVITENKVYPLS